MAKRVYFAFHYQDVIDFRANVVRKHNFTEGVESAGYYDYSIWEESKKSGDLGLKRMINSELENTSVTAVLIGSSTYARRWVRYEIIHSMFLGNRVIGVHINSIKGKDANTKTLGPNPFDYLQIRYNADGTTVSYLEWNGAAWVDYVDYPSYRLKTQAPSHKWGNGYQLSSERRVYDWVADDGYNNFSTWIGA